MALYYLRGPINQVQLQVIIQPDIIPLLNIWLSQVSRVVAEMCIKQIIEITIFVCYLKIYNCTILRLSQRKIHTVASRAALWDLGLKSHLKLTY